MQQAIHEFKLFSNNLVEEINANIPTPRNLMDRAVIVAASAKAYNDRSAKKMNELLTGKLAGSDPSALKIALTKIKVADLGRVFK